MSLSKIEKRALITEKLINNIFEHFDSISEIHINFYLVDDCPKYYNPQKNHFPLSIRIVNNNNQTSQFDWTPYFSDDQFPLYSKDGEHYGFNEVREYIQTNFPELFKGKSIYKEEGYYSNHNIEKETLAIKQKVFFENMQKSLPKRTAPSSLRKI